MGEHFGPEETRGARRRRVTERAPRGARIPFPTSAKMGSANHPASRGARERDVVKTILNRIQKQPRFVYEAMRLNGEGGRLILEVELRPRGNRRPRCSQCHRPRPG